MSVEALIPDIATGDAPAIAPVPPSGDGFGNLVASAGAMLDSADRAERAFAEHRGGLLEMVVERARADVALQVAAAGAQRVAQGLQTLLGMQI